MNRRDALRHSLAAASLFGLAEGARAATPALPDASLRASNPEAYWKRIRDEQFVLPEGRVFLNNGSLGVAPRPVLDAVASYLQRSAALELEEYPRWGYELMDDHRAELAAFLGCKKEELALMHNCTEAMSTVAAGLDLKAGDEVLITDQEHPSGRSCWLQRQARHGITVREVKLPVPAKSSAQLADVITSAIGPRTRVLSFSGVLTTMGTILPVRQICDAARAKGVLTVVDGAHMDGQIPVNISELHCDFFAGSPHKWMFAPAGCGFLYLRDEIQDSVWATTVTGGWDNKQSRAARFMMIGTNNRAIMEGMIAGLRFLKQLGPEVVYDRIHHLARMMYAKAREIPYIEMAASEDHTLYGGLVTFYIRKPNLEPLWKLCKQRRIWLLNGERLRLAAHIHTRPSDIDLFFRTMRETLG